MSGLYNMIVPQHPIAATLREAYQLDDEILGAIRYRNIYPMESGTAVLFTRLGSYDQYHEIIDHLRQHPRYIDDDAWDIDPTYRSFALRGVPEAWEMIREHGHLRTESPAEEFERILRDMQ